MLNRSLPAPGDASQRAHLKSCLPTEKLSRFYGQTVATGMRRRQGPFIGPNGRVAGKDGSVLLWQRGFRRIVRIAKDRSTTVL